MSQANKDINEKLWEALPTAPVPSLEEMKIEAEFNVFWQCIDFPATTMQVAELAYRKGRMAGKDAATREILGKR